MSDEKIPPNNNEDPDLRNRNRELEEKIRQLEEEKNKLSKKIENLEKENEIFKKENEIFKKELQAKGADIEELLKQNKDLKFRVNMNSSNSSKPPASDGLRKVIPVRNPEGSLVMLATA